jgi:hypothetical protein
MGKEAEGKCKGMREYSMFLFKKGRRRKFVRSWKRMGDDG